VDSKARASIVAELAASFGEAVDVSPSEDQPLHVLLPKLSVLPPWSPSPTRGLVRFANWPDQKPDFWIDVGLNNAKNEEPRSSSQQLILGSPWRQFSAAVPWPTEPKTATRAVQLWLNRFRDAT
jgi:hypothetical protein